MHRRIPTWFRPLGLTALIISLLSIAAAESLPTGAVELAPAHYSDLAPDHWAADAVERMTTLGVFTGYPGGLFDGTRQATRFELAVVAARLVDLLGSSLADLISDPDFQRAVEDAAGNNMRLLRLERITEEAANAAYVQQLGDRIAAVEEYLNLQAGVRLFPGRVADPDAPPLRAADGVGPLPEDTLASITSQLERDIEAAASEAQEQQPAEDSSAVILAGRGLWFGISGGYPQVSTLHVGIRDVIDNLHVRFSTGFALPDALNLELHALYEFSGLFEDSAYVLYAGAGPVGRIGKSGASASLSLIAGLEYHLAGPGSLFVEAGPLIDIAPVAGDMGVTVRAGLNYGF